MRDQLKRRKFLALVGGAAAWPLAARTQQSLPLIGYMGSRSPEASQHLVEAFRGGLKEAGYIEGQNVAIEFRWANGRVDRLPSMAADLVHRSVAVITATSTSRGKGRDHNHSDRLRDWRRPRGAGPRHQPELPGRQHHGRDPIGPRANAEVA
jgi:hypothetical protein